MRDLLDTPSDTNPICVKCGLYNTCLTPFMEPSGVDEPDILIIGEAPGETEDEDGEPFIGRAGRHLRNVLTEIGVDVETEVTFTNVVRCRPPDNKITKKAINLCAEFARKDIEKYNPEQVWLLGNSPLHGILGESGITSWNGVIVQKNGHTYVPLFHPAYILRDDSHLDDWLEGMLKAVEGHDEVEDFERIIPRSLWDLGDMYKFLSECEYISYDVETSSLDAFSEYSMIISVSFAAIHEDGRRKSYSYPIDHPESYWVDVDYPDVVQITSDIIKEHDGRLIGQFMKFDQMHTFSQFGISFRSGGDVMLISHLLDSRPGIHGLKRLAGIHLGWYEYEQELTDYCAAHPEANPKRGGSYAYIPLDILLPYGAMDAEATYLLHEMLYDQLSDKQKILYDQLSLPVSDALGTMQTNGMQLDMYVARRYTNIYKKRKREVYAEILDDAKVKKLTRARQKVLDDRIKGTRRKRKIFEFNPISYQQKIDLYYKYYKMPVLGKTDHDNPTTKAETLRPLEGEYPILQKIRYYNLLHKMISTYLEPAADGLWNSGDGRARTNYNQAGTITGRISSSDPFNAQNIPTPEKEPGTLLEILPIKNIFTHSYVYQDADNFYDMFRYGAVISIDFSGAELRVFASLANCEAMLRVHRSGADFHTSVAEMVSRIPYKSITKAVRYIYKWTNWTLLFGGDEYTLHRLYDIPLTEAEEVVKKYYKRFPEVLDFQEYCVEFTEDHGYIESPFGRREYLPWINETRNIKRRNRARREAMNMPVQSGASDTLLAALAMVDMIMKKDGHWKSKTINTVHDSMMFDSPIDEVEPIVALGVDVMENVQKHAKVYMPDVDFSWLKCPMKADAEIGTHYGAEDSIDVWRRNLQEVAVR